MRRRTFLGALAGGAVAGRAALAGPGGTDTPLRVVTLTGPARARGAAHGEELREKVREVVARWKDVLRAAYGRDPDAYLERFRAGTRFTPAIERWAPALLDEVLGIAEGSGVDYPTLYALQMLDEEWWFGSRLVDTEAADGHCSVVALERRGGRPAVLAQNMDIGGYTDGCEVLLRIKDGEREALVFSFAGFLGLTGLSASPLGVCVNTLAQLDSSEDGLPVAFVLRRLLETDSLARAEALLREVRHASGQSYTVADFEEAAAFECSARSVRRLAPVAGCVAHTNHPLVSDDQAQHRARLARRPARPASGPSNSEVRLDTLRRRLEASGEGADLATVRDILRSHDSEDHPVCRHKTSEAAVMTIGSLVMALGRPPELTLSPGPPCSTPAQTFRL